VYHSTLGVRVIKKRKKTRAARTARVEPRLYIACAPRRITRRVPALRAVPIGAVLSLRTTTSQKCEAVPRRARV